MGGYFDLLQFFGCFILEFLHLLFKFYVLSMQLLVNFLQGINLALEINAKGI